MRDAWPPVPTMQPSPEAHRRSPSGSRSTAAIFLPAFGVQRTLLISSPWPPGVQFAPARDTGTEDAGRKAFANENYNPTRIHLRAVSRAPRSCSAHGATSWNAEIASARAPCMGAPLKCRFRGRKAHSAASRHWPSRFSRQERPGCAVLPRPQQVSPRGCPGTLCVLCRRGSCVLGDLHLLPRRGSYPLRRAGEFRLSARNIVTARRFRVGVHVDQPPRILRGARGARR